MLMRAIALNAIEVVTDAVALIVLALVVIAKAIPVNQIGRKWKV
jgi:hypothetical protein